MRSTRPLYRYLQASIGFQKEGSESSLLGGKEIEEMEFLSVTHAVVQNGSILLSSNSPVTPKKVECPLCYSLFSSEEIELKAPNCSGDNHYRPDFIDLALQVDDEAGDTMYGGEEIPKKGPREEVPKSYSKEDLMAALELPLSKQRTAGNESIRIMRNSAWKDYTNYMQKPMEAQWLQK